MRNGPSGWALFHGAGWADGVMPFGGAVVLGGDRTLYGMVLCSAVAVVAALAKAKVCSVERAPG
jgi:hypothetical protein